MTSRAGWIALGVSLVAVTGVYIYGDALPELDQVFPNHVTAVDGAGEIDGNELTLAGVRTVAEADIPSGTTVLAADFDVIPDAESGSCPSVRLVEDRGAQRTWTSSSQYPSDNFSDALCGSDDGPTTVTVGFLVPTDISDDLHIEISSTTLGVDPVWFPLPGDSVVMR